MLDTQNIEIALDKVRHAKETFGAKKGEPVKVEDYRRLCNCEKTLVGAIAVIGTINRGDFEKYYVNKMRVYYHDRKFL